MMAKKPEQRYAIPADVATALLPYCGQTAPMAVLVTTAVSGLAPAAVAVDSLPTAALPAPVAMLASDETPTCAPAAVPLLGSETIPPDFAASSETVAALPRPVMPRRRRRWLLAGAALVLLAGVIVLTVRPGGKPATTNPDGPTLALDPLDRLDPKQIPPEDRLPGQPAELVAVLGQHRPYMDTPALLAVSDDGKQAALVAGTVVLLFDPEALRVRHRLGHAANDRVTTHLAFSGDGKRLAYGTDAGNVSIRDTATGSELRRTEVFSLKGRITAVALSNDGKRLLAGCSDGTLSLCNTDTGKELYAFVKQSGSIRSVLFTPDGRLAFSSSAEEGPQATGNTQLRMWNIESGKAERQFDSPGEPKGNLLLSRDGRRLFCWSGDTLRAWDVTDASKGVTSIHRDNPNVAATQMALSPDGKFIWWVSKHPPEGTKLLEVATGRTLRTFGTGAGAFLPDSQRVICVSGATVTQVDVTTGADLKPVVGHSAPVLGLAFSRDGRYLLSGGNGDLILWDLTTREPRRVASAPDIVPITFFPDGRRALAGGTNFQIWDLESGRSLRSLGRYSAANLTPDGRQVLYLTSPNNIYNLHLLDVEKGGELRTFKRPQDTAAILAFGVVPGDTRAYSLETGAVRLWDPATAAELRAIGTPGASLVQFSPDGNRMFTAHDEASVKRWDLTGKEPRSQTFDRLNTSTVHSLALSPDGTRLVSGDPDRRIVLWTATSETGKPSREWFQRSTFNQLLFAPDSRHLAIANTDGTIYILRLAPPPTR